MAQRAGACAAHRDVGAGRDGRAWRTSSAPGMDVVETKYDNLGRLWQQSRPFRAERSFRGGQTPQWTVIEYDALGRVTVQRAPDGSEVRTSEQPDETPECGQVLLGQTSEGRCLGESTGRRRSPRPTGAGRRAESGGTGSVIDPGSIRTSYEYNAQDQVVTALQGPLGAWTFSLLPLRLGRDGLRINVCREERTLNVRGCTAAQGRVGATFSPMMSART